MKLAIIDVIGLHYDGTTLEKRGIGGSESSIISIAKELAKIGFDVTIYNNCRTDDTNPGVYDNVTYLPIEDLEHNRPEYDIAISQRAVFPFVEKDQFDQVRFPFPRDHFKCEWFEQFRKPGVFKVLWMQDTFIWGDLLLEELVTKQKINEVFNLSDWHIAYTTNCNHGKKRIFEVLKEHIFHTRNGINRWINEVDIRAKDPNLFVYNASVTKGMIPLVHDIWPKLKLQLPQAKLKIVGGYYDFKNEPDTPYKKDWIKLTEEAAKDSSISFTGIIPQPEIAALLAKASFSIYPGAYPETSGISILESVNYNTPVIGTRFGALAETGTEHCGYYIDYAIEPNSLYPLLNKEEQVSKFVSLACNAYHNKYLHQQKMYACDMVKELSTWDTIALQWKEHFYYKFGKKLSDVEQDTVDWINYRVHKVFEKRFTNPETIRTNYVKPTLVSPIVQNDVSIAIIDIMGACYDGSTLERRGLGGSEASVIQIAKELSKIGFRVTVYNACDENECQPGLYDSVEYKPLSALAEHKLYDVVISSRTATPFIPYNSNQNQRNVRKVPPESFTAIQQAKHKVLWMHDTFCSDDARLEQLISERHIDELWVLSDFHYSYVTNCTHGSTFGKMRSYEVLRNHTWITRNGMKLPEKANILEVDKFANTFVFNSNRSKGLKTLLSEVWPKLKERLPDAKLSVVGGYYKLDKAAEHDNEYEDFKQMVGSSFEDESITFTGILSLEQIYDLYSKSSYLLYPTNDPETFGISTLEAQYHGMLAITSKFGALEEVAKPSNTMINYANTPNALKHDTDSDKQADIMVDLVLESIKSNKQVDNLEQLRSLAGWNVVAAEWKYHLYQKLGLYLSPTESEQALASTAGWQQVFGRRFSSPEQWLAPPLSKESKIVVISPFYNAAPYLERCIHSIAAQMYNNYEHILIDDCSTDNSIQIAMNAIEKLPKNLRKRFSVVSNKSNQGAVKNHIKTIRAQDPKSIIILLDGDDALVNRPDLFSFYNRIHRSYDFTYGSCWSEVDNIPLHSQTYPAHIRNNLDYRKHKFNWVVPYTHLRTFKAKLLKYAEDKDFQDSNGTWFKAGGDLATFYKAIETCEPDKVYCVSDLVCLYNDKNPLNDYKCNSKEQTKTVNEIVKTGPKRILIAIPCKNDIEADTFKSIYDLIVPEGYTTQFQYFYGYAVDQVRNLIADWVVKGFDYLFAVDHDMVFPPDTLCKLLSHDKDLVSAVYRQRLEDQHIELYDSKYQRLGVKDIKSQALMSIGACGFGCVLVKRNVLAEVGYPQFVYHQSLDHNKTFSEDLDFCQKANEKGFKLFADASILCNHIGSKMFSVTLDAVEEPTESEEKSRLRSLSKADLLPVNHKLYLAAMKEQQKLNPKVIYDIGACVLHWTNSAKKVWPHSKFVVFEAMKETEFLYQEQNLAYVSGAVLYKKDNEQIEFYQNLTHPGGNSIYRENSELSPDAAHLFSEASKVTKVGMTLDSLVKMFKFPAPDLIKMDVQGAEMDILLGATEALKTCSDLILELQTEEYNIGAPKMQEVVTYLKSLGFVLVKEKFSSSSEFDADYHFRKKNS